MVPSLPHPAAAQVYAGEWFESFNSLVEQAKSLAFAVLGLVVVVGVLTALHVSKGAIVKVVMAGLTGAVAIWLATNAEENAERTDTEFTGGGTNGAPAPLLFPGRPGDTAPVAFTRGAQTTQVSASRPGRTEPSLPVVRRGVEVTGVPVSSPGPADSARVVPAAFSFGTEAAGVSVPLFGSAVPGDMVPVPFPGGTGTGGASTSGPGMVTGVVVPAAVAGAHSGVPGSSHEITIVRAGG